MPLRRLISLSSLVLAVAALTPATALGAANGTDRPVSGTSTSTTILNTATGTGVSDGIGQLSHLGAFTFHNDFTSFTVTGPNTFSYTLTTIWVAANGDEFFSTGTATGTLTSGIKSYCQHDHWRHRSLRRRQRDDYVERHQRKRLRRAPRHRDSRRTDQLLTGRNRPGRRQRRPRSEIIEGEGGIGSMTSSHCGKVVYGAPR